MAKTSTTPYHPQSNGLVERNNRGLGDSLRALLLRGGQDEWDLILPQIMRAFRGTPHTTTGEAANLMMLGRELRLPDQIQFSPLDKQHQSTQEFVQEVQKRLSQVHDMLREEQCTNRQEDQEEPPLFAERDQVWMVNKRRRKGENPKLQAKFLGPYEVIQAYGNHTYLIERQGQQSVQSESRLKLYKACGEAVGQAPATIEPTRRPNMKGAVKKTMRRATELMVPVPQPPENPEGAIPPPEPVAPPPERARLAPKDWALLESIIKNVPKDTRTTTPTCEDVPIPGDPVGDVRPPEPVVNTPPTDVSPPEVAEEVYSRPRRNTRPQDRYQAGYASVIQEPLADRERITSAGSDVTNIVTAVEITPGRDSSRGRG